MDVPAASKYVFLVEAFKLFYDIYNEKGCTKTYSIPLKYQLIITFSAGRLYKEDLPIQTYLAELNDLCYAGAETLTADVTCEVSGTLCFCCLPACKARQTQKARIQYRRCLHWFVCLMNVDKPKHTEKGYHKDSVLKSSRKFVQGPT